MSYAPIAQDWHRSAGQDGGPIKAGGLNRAVDKALGPDLSELKILELGAGNGYFFPWVLKRRKGQSPKRIEITDQCRPLVELGRRQFRDGRLKFQTVDLARRLSYGGGIFDLVLADLVLHELPRGSLSRALSEMRRVLSPEGRMVITVYHSRYLELLKRRRLTRALPDGSLSVPWLGRYRTPVFPRSLDQWRALGRQHGLQLRHQAVESPPSLETLPGLRGVQPLPMFLLLTHRPPPKRRSR